MGATVRLDSYNLVTDSISDYRYGEHHYIGGTPDEEIYKRSFPGSSGILEVFSGDREQIIQVRCTWHTNDAPALEAYLREVRADRRYRTLRVKSGAGGDYTDQYCRLESFPPLGERTTGRLDGAQCIVLSKMLNFIQVRTSEE